MNIQAKSSSALQSALLTKNIKEINKAIDLDPSRINEKDDQLGWSPLYKTVIQGEKEIVAILLERGADPNVKTKQGDTPLHFCVENENFDILQLLIFNSKTDLNIPGPEGVTPLHAACYWNKEEYVSCLLNAGANVDAQTERGVTALLIAAESGNQRLLKLILSRKPRIDIINMDGQSIWDICTDKGCHSLLEEYENNQINPLDDSMHNDQQNISQISMQSSQKSSSNSKIVDIEELKRKWDNKIIGLQKNIRDVAELKEGVSKTLEEMKMKDQRISWKSNEDKENHNNSNIMFTSNIKSVTDFNSGQKIISEKVSVNRNSNNQQLYASGRISNGSRNNGDIQGKKQETQFCNVAAFCSDQIERQSEVNNVPQQYSKNNNQQNNKNNNINISNHNRSNKTNLNINIKVKKTISKWLREIHLVSLLQNFLDNNVFDNQSLLRFLTNSQDWDKLLITLFGVDKYGHRQRIITRILEDCGVEKREGIFMLKYTLGGIDLPDVESWLRTQQLEAFADLFILSGFDDLESILFQMTTAHPLTDEILLEEIGIRDTSARIQILQSLRNDAMNAKNTAITQQFQGGAQLELPSQNDILPKCENKCAIF